MRSTQNLKRDLLLFDRIQVMGLHWQIRGDAEARGIPRLADAAVADCEYLIDRGVLGTAPAFTPEVSELVWRSADSMDDEDYEPWDGETSLSSLPPRQQASLLASASRHPSALLPWDRPMPGGSEIVVAHTTSLLGDKAVAVLDRPVSRAAWAEIRGTFIMDSHGRSQREGAVTEVVLPHVPVPGSDVPLEAILDFRNEPTTARQIESLKLWMRRAAFSESSAEELELELDSMLHDFRVHMDLADMRAGTNALQLAISVPLHVAQELLHLRPRAALDALYFLRTTRADRLEAELKAPGSEVAYLHTTSARFD